MKNDQWFEPGEKVTRVQYGFDLGVSRRWTSICKEADFGKVLCVKECWKGALGLNEVMFVGVNAGRHGESPFLACCFRRVEEIRLCVQAAKKCGTREEVEA